MWRYFAGAAAMLALVASGFFLSRQMAASAVTLPALPPKFSSEMGDTAVSGAPVADEATREARRFARYDKDKDGSFGAAECLATRQKAFARIDTNHDGVLSFAEYAAKTTEKFKKADVNRSGGLDPKEFATTKPVRKARPAANCPPPTQPAKVTEGESEPEG